MHHLFTTLRFRLILLVFLAVLPALGVVLYSGLEQRRLAAEAAQKNVLDLVHHASLYQERVVEEVRQTLFILAELPAVRQQDGAVCSAIFARIMEKQKIYGNISVADRQGKVYATARPQPGLAPSDAGRSHFEQALKTRDFAIGEFGIGRTSGKATIHFGYPVLDHGVVQGVVSASVVLDYLNTLVARSQMPTGSMLTVIDRDGTILARHPQPEQWLGKRMPEPEIIKIVLAKEEGIAEAVGIDGLPCLFAFTPLEAGSHDLFVYAGVPLKTVYAEAHRTLTRNLLALGGAGLLALVAAWLLGQFFLISRTRTLVNTSQQLAGGDLAVRSHLSYDDGEFGQLAQSFDEMAATLQQRQESLRESEEKYRTLVENVDLGITLISSDYKVIMANAGMGKLFHKPPEEIVGKYCFREFEKREGICPHCPGVKAMASGQPAEVDTVGVLDDGTFHYAHVRTFPTFDPLGNVTGFIELIENTTARRQAEEALSASEAKYRALIETTDTGFVIIDPQGKVLDANQEYLRLTGYDSLAEILGRSVTEWTAAEDLQRNAAAVQEGVEKGFVRNLEIAYVQRKGETIPIEINATLIQDASGKKILSLVRDITGRKKGEQALEETSRKLHILLAETEERNRTITLLHEMSDTLQTCQLFEEASKVIAHFAPKFFPQDIGSLYVFRNSKNLLISVAAWGMDPSQNGMFAPEECWAIRSGRVHAVEGPESGLMCGHIPDSYRGSYLCVPMVAQGESLGILHLRLGANEQCGSGNAPPAELLRARQRLAMTIAENISLALANLKLRETLHTQAIRDPLTGLFNRRYMEETLTRELHRIKRLGSSLGVIMMDLDHFKQFNDTYGHNAGDALLSALGNLIQSQCREEDIPCRFGGEEFLLILPGASLEVTEARAQQLQETIKQLQVYYRGQLLQPTTMSLGVALFPDHGSNGEVIIGAADTALYRAKQEGRDRVVVVHELRGNQDGMAAGVATH